MIWRIQDLKEQLSAEAELCGPASGKRYACKQSFVLAHGRGFHARSLPKPYRRGAIAGRRFANARNLAERFGLDYVEGYAFLNCPQCRHHHAWCAEPNCDFAIDPTWGTRAAVPATRTPGCPRCSDNGQSWGRAGGCACRGMSSGRRAGGIAAGGLRSGPGGAGGPPWDARA